MGMLLRIKRTLQSRLTVEDVRKLKRIQGLRFRLIQHWIFRLFIGSNLKQLALVYGTDKWDLHWYAQHYQFHFEDLRHRKLNLLEIGVGGYDDPTLGGGSLRMWRTYFPRARVFGIDIFDKSPHDERRIKTFIGSQIDASFLERVMREIGNVQIIIDDGSHKNPHVLTTFQTLFPLLDDGGFYVIEDTQTSYWAREGGSSTELSTKGTSMGYFKGLVDGLNFAEFEIDKYEPTYYDKNIVGIHFYHNMVFIRKGMNNEKSNIRQPQPEESGRIS